MSQTSDGEEDTNSEISLILGKEAEKASEMETSDEAADPGNFRMVRSYSPVPSVLSMMSDHSKGDPPYFSNETVPIKSRMVRSYSPVPSVLSMMSDHSKGDPPYFSNETVPMESRMVRSYSPVPSVLSMMSDHSKSDPPYFSNETVPMESRIREQAGLAEIHSDSQCRKRLRGRICDVCPEGRAWAVKFCQTCGASYCEAHIRDHYTAEPLQIHKLQDITEDMDSRQEEEKWPSGSKVCRPTSILQNDSWKKCLRVSASAGCVLAVLLSFIILTPKESGRSPAPHDLRIVLLGKTGAGKSATGNTILGREAFQEGFSPKSVSSKCETRSGEVAGRNVTVMDTPGIFHTSLSSDQIKREMADSINDLFLLVIRLGRFTDEDRATPKWLQENFGEEALQYTMLLFTGGDELRTPVKEFLRESSDLQELIHRCGGGFYIFNNKDKNNHCQVTELLEKIEAVLFKMTGYHHATKMIQQAQRKIQTEEERKREEAEREIRTEKDGKMIILAFVMAFIIFVAVVFTNQKIQKIKAEQKTKREEAEREIRAEEERKREELEREIRAEEERKREELEREIRAEEERKREELEREIREKEERKREELEREIRAEEERKREEAMNKVRDDALRKRQILERKMRKEIEEMKKKTGAGANPS